MKDMKVCEQCGEEYEEGAGVSEDDMCRIRLTERFCCDSCANEYNRQMAGDDEDEP